MRVTTVDRGLCTACCGSSREHMCPTRPIAQHTHAHMTPAALAHQRPSRCSLAAFHRPEADAAVHWRRNRERATNHHECQRRPQSSRTCSAICRKVRSSVVHDNAPTSGRCAAYEVAAAAAEQQTRRGDGLLECSRERRVMLLLLFR